MADYTVTVPDVSTTTTLTGVPALQAALANYEKQLYNISVDPKPSYSIDGETVDWTTYQKFLREQISQLKKDIIARSPYIIKTRMSL